MHRHGILLLIAVLALGFGSPAYAHPGHATPGNGMAAGLLHPLLGWDHLLAMVTVGLLSAQLGGSALWALPTAFVTSMMLGGAAGMWGWELPAIEYGIAGSVVVLGGAVAFNRRTPLAPVLAAVGLFGFVHGQAHGLEMPRIDSPLLYAAGFVLATIALHAAGVSMGLLAGRSVYGVDGLRWSGVAVAAAGGFLLTTM